MTMETSITYFEEPTTLAFGSWDPYFCWCHPLILRVCPMCSYSVADLPRFWFFIGSARAPQQAEFGVLRGARADPRKNSLYKLQPKFFLLQFHVLCSESPILLSASLSGFPMKYCISALRLLESHFLVKSNILLLDHVRSYYQYLFGFIWYHSPDFPWKQTR